MKLRVKSAENSNHIDLTPMLDVVFIMFIFFIVTASFVKEKALTMAGQAEVEGPQSEHAALLFSVDSTNQITMEGRQVDVRSLRSIIAQRRAINPGATSVILRAHEVASVDSYMAVLDAARQENIDQIALSTYYE
ncbi:biopolymer transport protein ExbD [Alteromonadaceae bacterium Bs31]|nr:biopolymer transport protein ExbD [Alteromonadaceae bacterium Bs31]